MKKIVTGWTAKGKGADWKWGRGGRASEQALNWMDTTIEPLVCACHATHFPPFTDLRAAVCIVMSEQPRTNNGGGGLPEGGGHQAKRCENRFKRFVQLVWSKHLHYLSDVKETKCYHPLYVAGNSNINEGSKKYNQLSVSCFLESTASCLSCSM